MEVKGPNHVFEVVPPYLNNREIPAILQQKFLAEIKAAEPDLDERTVWEKAKERVIAENDQIWFGLRGISQPEADKLERECLNLYNDFSRDKAAEHEAGKRLELIKSKVDSINNLVVDGELLTTFDAFYAKAPREMVQWLCGTVNNSLTLSLSERKNFLPE